MAKDYFQDIMPPSGAPGRSIPISKPQESPSLEPPEEENVDAESPPERSIRNISMPQRRPRGGEQKPPAPPGPSFSSLEVAPSPGSKRLWIWAAALLVTLLLGVVGLLALRPTTVTVVPKSHAVLFDDASTLSAYPESVAATGALSYRIESVRLEDSEVVPSSGMERVEEKASGTITVYNAYSAAPTRLIKNTRFETPDGLIFRTPSEIVIPGKKGATPGEISVTVVADKAGEAYNVGPVAKFTVPGLKDTPAMFSGVYARSSASMSGGFSGDRPAVSPGALESAQSAVRDRLLAKARDSVASKTNDADIALVGLADISYTSLPRTAEAGGGVRIHEEAAVDIPVFSTSALAREVATWVSADAETSTTVLVPGKDFTAQRGTSALTKSLTFTLSGTATLVWIVDRNALAEALSGKMEGDFETIVSAFPGIQEARARVEPFWKNTFPKDAADIVIRVEEPKSP
jgi:hypothetical protein